VNPVNDAPTANAGSATTDEDTAVTITLTGTDIDGDTLSFEVASGPSQGGLVISGSTATYTPNADYHGPDSFTFVAKDTGRGAERPGHGQHHREPGERCADGERRVGDDR
jgi:large repetitive protein